MTENELFGELRSAAQTPDEASWARIVAAIGQWPDAESFAQTALPYLMEQMKAPGWAEVARVAPAGWAEANHPALGLADGLDLTKSELDADALIEVLMTRPGGAPGWRMLSLDETRADEAVLKALGASACVYTLTHLSLQGCGQLTQAAIAALAASSWPALRELDIRDLKLNVEALYPLLESPLALQLDALHVRGCEAGHRDDLFSAFSSLMMQLDEQISPHNLAGSPEEVRRARALHRMLEDQLVDWATELHAGDDLGIEFGTFYDLME